MSTPGFTAEKSLRRSRLTYSTRARTTSTTNVVVPAELVVCPEEYVACIMVPATCGFYLGCLLEHDVIPVP
jgi:hypothetical protein